MKSKVKWFDSEKGYGFVEYNGQDVYIHYTSIIDQKKGYKNLVEGEYISFSVVSTDKGLRAKNVRTAV